MGMPPLFGGAAGLGGIGGMLPSAPGAMGFPGEKNAVILVNNLPVDSGITPETLFTLCGVYGDVMRVKILFNKRSSAFVQFAAAHQAQAALLNLQNVVLFGSVLNLTSSKHAEISLPRSDTEEGADLTRDFSSSQAHRFAGRNFRNAQHVHPPSPVLHISNLPEGISEAEIRTLFGTAGGQQTEPAVQFFVNNRKMAFVKMDSTEHAVIALIRTHNTKHGGAYLRVSFSVKDAGAVSDSDTSPGEVFSQALAKVAVAAAASKE
jgi:hnRNP-L/PTB/hephaestus splicing factor